MSKVFNMVSGGGKNISSIVITGLESTDTITCTKDGKSYTATYDSTTQHWEIVGLPLGTFIVTATNGTKTKTETVLIDITGVYEIDMSFKLWLYKNGDECEDVTGGWNALGSGSSGSLTKNASSFTLVYSSGSNAYDAITKNTVDISNYSKLYIDWIFNPAKGGNARIGIASSVPSGDVGLSKFSIISKSYTGVTELDVSDVSGQYYAVVTVYNESVTVNKIWLE